MNVVLFHSMLGLRPVEHAAAQRLRGAGLKVTTPDLYEGQAASTLEEGFTLMRGVGWTTIVERAHRAMHDLPADTLLAGISMGAGVVSNLLPHRPDTAGLLLLHGLAGLPATVRSGLAIQVHVAEQDDFVPPAERSQWQHAAACAGAQAQLFTYAGVGHFYTDASLPGHNALAAGLTWERVLRFLEDLPRRRSA